MCIILNHKFGHKYFCQELCLLRWRDVYLDNSCRVQYCKNLQRMQPHFSINFTVNRFAIDHSPTIKTLTDTIIVICWSPLAIVHLLSLNSIFTSSFLSCWFSTIASLHIQFSQLLLSRDECHRSTKRTNDNSRKYPSWFFFLTNKQTFFPCKLL